MKYRPEIDGMRAFAVLINHFDKRILPSGYLGVDIFFVISGYVITSSLSSRNHSSFVDFLLAFYERRIKRIIPALVFCVSITGIVIAFLDPNPSISLNTALTSLFGVSNLYLSKISTDYFSQATELNPFVQTWSLAVEEQFYLVYPLLFWFTGFSRSARGRSILAFCLLVFSSVSLYAFITLNPASHPYIYFLMPPRFWELAAGCLISCSLQHSPFILGLASRIPSLLVCALIVPLLFTSSDNIVPSTISVVLLTGLLLLSLENGSSVYRIFTYKHIVQTGLLSYSLYLWHWVVLSISRWTVGIHWWSLPFQLILILILSIASYCFIEEPLRRRDWCSTRILTITSGLFILTISATLLKIVGVISEHVILPYSRKTSVVYSERILWDHSSCVFDRTDFHLPGPSDFEKCFIAKSSSNITNSGPLVFWYGNSYNEQLMPAAATISSLHGIRMNSFAVIGCPPTLRLSYSEEKIPGYCASSFRKYLEFAIDHSPRGSKFVIAASPTYWHGPSGKLSALSLGSRMLTFSQARQNFIDELFQISRLLKKKDLSLLVTSGIPELMSDPNVCSNPLSYYNDACHPVASQSGFVSNRSLVSLLSSTQLLSSGLTIIDIYSPLEMYIRSNGSDIFALYYNQTHLTKKGASLLIPVIAKSLLNS